LTNYTVVIFECPLLVRFDAVLVPPYLDGGMVR